MAAAGQTRQTCAALKDPPPPQSHLLTQPRNQHLRPNSCNYSLNINPQHLYPREHNLDLMRENDGIKQEAQKMAPAVSDDHVSSMSPLSTTGYCKGSSLFKSMKYAETWLNLTVADRGVDKRSRPKLLFDDRPSFFVDAIACSCPDSDRLTKSNMPPQMCHKCIGRHLQYQPDVNKTKCKVNQFNSVRLSRNVSNKRDPIFGNNKGYPDDPYSIMRRCRLKSPPNDKTEEKLKKYNEGRARSSSPTSRRKQKIKAESVIKANRCPSPDGMSSLWDNNVKQNETETHTLNGCAGRKSILDCSVSAYELMTLKNVSGCDKPKSNLRTNNKELFKDIGSKDYSRNKSSSKFNTLTSTLSKGKFLISFLNSEQHNKESQRESSPAAVGVKIAGQRMKIFDEITRTRMDAHGDQIDEFVSESEQSDDSNEIISFSNAKNSCDDEVEMEVRRPPIRPQRKTKGKNDESEDFNLNGPLQDLVPSSPPRMELLIVPKNRVNFYLDQDNNFNKNNTLTSSTSLEIKSILKKPPDFNRLFNFNNILKSDATYESYENKPSRRKEMTPEVPIPENIYEECVNLDTNPCRPTVIILDGNENSLSADSQNIAGLKQVNIVNKKKKQVQFKVNKIEVIPTYLVDETNGDKKVPQPLKQRAEVPIQGNLPVENGPGMVFLQPIYDELTIEYDRRKENQPIRNIDQPRKTMDEVSPSIANFYATDKQEFHSKDGSIPAIKRLQRSLSERTAEFPPRLNGRQEFMDTMRLNLRMGRRGNSRVLFALDENEKISGIQRVINPSCSRPKEPPPAPPTLKRALSPPKPPPRLIFPFAKKATKLDELAVSSASTASITSSLNSIPFKNDPGYQTSSSSQKLIDAENNYIDLCFKSETEPITELDESESKLKIEIKCDSHETCERTNEADLNIDSQSKACETIVPKKTEGAAIVSIVPIDSSTRKVSTVIINGEAHESHTGRYQSSIAIKRPSSVDIYENPLDGISGDSKITINVGDFKSGNSTSFYHNSIPINNQTEGDSAEPTTMAGTKQNSRAYSIDNEIEGKTIQPLIEAQVTLPLNQNQMIEDQPKKQAQNYFELQEIMTEIDTRQREGDSPETHKQELEIDQIQINASPAHLKSGDSVNSMSNLMRHNYDPILAVRQNLIPHICGKLVTNPASDAAKRQSMKCNWDSSNETNDKVPSTPPSPSTVSNCDEKPETFYSSKNILAEDHTNHYESLFDPIYEEISDIPPPLPLSPPPPLKTLEEIIDDTIPTRSIFEGASKYDILCYLVDAKQRCISTVAEAEEPEYVIEESIRNQTIIEEENETPTSGHLRVNALHLSCSRHSQVSCSDSSEDSCYLNSFSANNSVRLSDKVRKSCVEIERNDSGVGSETSQCSRSKWQHLSNDKFKEDQQHICEDCDQAVETQVFDGSGLMFAPLVCRKCSKRRAERREIIAEIMETEEKYGRDLRIILDEFYRPMLVAGLLTPEQLTYIFLNVEELLENNIVLAEKLRDALEIAAEHGDEDLLTVNIGRIFLETTSMLHAFESYCTKQGAAALMLANLEKEKELLRIFLRVSQMENSVLRRMNLNSFLMVPVQRVTKFPLLLARLYKVTPAHHPDRELLKEAQHKIELHLEHMNSSAKDFGSTKLWRRISIINGRRSNNETDMVTIKLRKIAVDVLDWMQEDVRFAVEGRLLFTQPTDHNWWRGRTIKLSPINAMVVTLGKPTENFQPESMLIPTFPRDHGIRDASLLLLKEKNGRFALLREPLFLDRCIVCTDNEWEEYFEVQELVTKDTYIFKAEDNEKTKLWCRQVQYLAQGLGQWRRRRNALANIMINGMQLRS